MTTESLLHNGWREIVSKRGHNEGYVRYRNQIVVIVPSFAKKQQFIGITPACFEALGKPERIGLFERGTNIALIAVENRGFRLSHAKEGAVNIHYISASAWLEERARNGKPLKIGVYDAHIENNNGGIIVFDSAQTPARL